MGREERLCVDRQPVLEIRRGGDAAGNGRSGSAMAPARAVKDKKELALRQSWAVDKLVQQKEDGEDLIAKLARKVIDHYLYFQGRIRASRKTLTISTASPTNAGS